MTLEGAWPRAGEQTSPAHSQGGRGGRTNRSQPRAWSWNQPAPDDETQEGEGKRQDQRILLENRARESQRPPAVGTAKRAPGRGQTRDVIPRRKKTTTGLWGAPRLRMARKKNVNLKKKSVFTETHGRRHGACISGERVSASVKHLQEKPDGVSTRTWTWTWTREMAYLTVGTGLPCTHVCRHSPGCT